MSVSYFDNSQLSLEPKELNEFYTLCGANKTNQRTLAKIKAVLDGSPFYTQARHQEQLVGFGCLIINPYFAIVLDLMTHPDYQRQGIATEILKRVIACCQTHELPVNLIDGSGITGFYEKMGFRQADPNKERIMYLKTL